MIRGITVTLYERTESGTDAFGAPEYTETPVTVENVLVTPVRAEDAANALELHGKHTVYTLCIPKGDTHTWTERRVDFLGESWRTVGTGREYIERMVPLGWNRQIEVERYE